jgi:hypothetical protein
MDARPQGPRPPPQPHLAAGVAAGVLRILCAVAAAARRRRRRRAVAVVVHAGAAVGSVAVV